METIPEAEAVDQVPDEQLWLGVSVTDAAHALAALGLGECIDHAVITDYPAGPPTLVARGRRAPCSGRRPPCTAPDGPSVARPSSRVAARLEARVTGRRGT